MKRSLLVLLMVLSACGGTSVDTSTPETLHNSWIAAAQDGDTEALNTMIPEGTQAYAGIPEADEVRVLVVDHSDYAEYGQVYGKSIWSLGGSESCLIGTMQEVNGEWRMGFWREYPMEQCTRE